MHNFFVKEVQTFCDRGNPFEEGEDEEDAQAPAAAPSAAPGESPGLEVLEEGSRESGRAMPFARSANTTSEVAAMPRKMGMGDKSAGAKIDGEGAVASKSPKETGLKASSLVPKANSTMGTQLPG